MSGNRARLLVVVLLAFTVCFVNLVDYHSDCHNDCTSCGCQRNHGCTCALIVELCAVGLPCSQLTSLPEDHALIPQVIPNTIFQPPKHSA